METKPTFHLHSQAKEVVFNVSQYFISEKQYGGVFDDVSKAIDRAAAATKLSKSTIGRIRKEAKDNEEIDSPGFTSPKKRQRIKPVTGFFDEFHEQMLRKIVLELNEREQIPTLKKIQEELKSKISYAGSPETLRIVLKKMGIRCTNVDGRRCFTERELLRVQRGISSEPTATEEESDPQPTTTTTTTDATTTTTTTTTATTTDTPPASTEHQTEQLAALQHQLAEMTHARDYYYYEMYKKDTELTALQQQVQQQQQQQSSEVQQKPEQQDQQKTTGGENKVTNHLDKQNAMEFFDLISNPEMENLRKQLEDLQLVLYNKDSEIQQLKESAAHPPPHTEHNGTAGRETEVSEEHLDKAAHATLQQESTTLKQQVKEYEIHVKQLQTQLETAVAAAAAATAASVAAGLGSVTTAEARCKQQLEDELDTIRREQEDLLVLVTDQDSKISEYRRKLRTYGEDVTEDEDEEDEDGEFAITENYDDDLEDIQ